MAPISHHVLAKRPHNGLQGIYVITLPSRTLSLLFHYSALHQLHSSLASLPRVSGPARHSSGIHSSFPMPRIVIPDTSPTLTL